MTAFIKVAIGCDEPSGDGFCPARTPEFTGHDALARAGRHAESQGWVTVPRGTGIPGLSEHFCPAHSAGKGGS